MTEFKIGDKVLVKPGEVSRYGWAPKDYTTPLTVSYVQHGLVAVLDDALEYSFRPEQLTPAPLDPSKVKPGDTVTLSRGKSSVTAEVTHVQSFIHLEHLGRFRVKGLSSDRTSGYAEYTLTDHQPAPAPEWKPGTVADITVHPSGVLRAVRARTGNYWAADTEEVYSDDEVESVRPLVVLDPESDTDRLSNIIREVDGNHDKGAASLAEAILERLSR